MGAPAFDAAEMVVGAAAAVATHAAKAAIRAFCTFILTQLAMNLNGEACHDLAGEGKLCPGISAQGLALYIHAPRYAAGIISSRAP